MSIFAESNEANDAPDSAKDTEQLSNSNNATDSATMLESPTKRHKSPTKRHKSPTKHLSNGALVSSKAKKTISFDVAETDIGESIQQSLDNDDNEKMQRVEVDNIALDSPTLDTSQGKREKSKKKKKRSHADLESSELSTVDTSVLESETIKKKKKGRRSKSELPNLDSTAELSSLNITNGSESHDVETGNSKKKKKKKNREKAEK